MPSWYLVIIRRINQTIISEFLSPYLSVNKPPFPPLNMAESDFVCLDDLDLQWSDLDNEFGSIDCPALDDLDLQDVSLDFTDTDLDVLLGSNDKNNSDSPSSSDSVVLGSGINDEITNKNACSPDSECKDDKTDHEGQNSQNTEPKRQLRLIRNREAASLSRQRKKSYIEGLESKCKMWESQCSQLQRLISFLSAENTTLRNELVRSKRQRHGSDALEPAVLSDSLPLESQLHLTILMAAYLVIGTHCLGLLLPMLLVLLLGEATRLNVEKDVDPNRIESGSLNFSPLLSRKESWVQALFPIRRLRAFSFCRHRFRKKLKCLEIIDVHVLV